MASKRSRDFGFEKAVFAGAGSPHSHARSVISNYQRVVGSCRRTDAVNEWADGEIPFGFIEDGSAPKGMLSRLKLSWLQRHCLIIGPSGVGKTNLSKIIASGIMENLPIMIFDRTGDHLKAYSKSALIFPIKNFRINPNEEPEGVDFDTWLEDFSSVFIFSLILTDVTRGSFVQLARYTNERFKLNEGDLRPSIYEQRLALSEIKPRSYRDSTVIQYWNRLEQRYDYMLSSVLRDIFACYRGHDIPSLLKQNVIFDCRGLSSQNLRILVSLIISKIYCYRLYNEHGGIPLHGILLEEAEDIYGVKNSGGFLENPLDDLTRRVRGRGEFLIVLNQTCTTLSRALRSNIYIQFMLGATNSIERSEMGRSIGLRDDQWNEAIRLDTPRAFVAKEGSDPLLVSIPEYKTQKINAEPSRVIKSPDELHYIPIPDDVRNSVFRKIMSVQSTTMADIKKERETLQHKKMLELLSDIAKNPFATVTARTNLSFGKSRADLFKIMNKAKDQKLVSQITAKATRGPGQKGIFLELTRRGIDLLIENNLWKPGKPYYHGKMGFSGALLMHGLLIPHFEEMGFQVMVEGINKGYDCDIGLIGKDGLQEIAVELSVYTTAKQELSNILRNFSSGWKSVWCIVCAFEKGENEAIESEKKTEEKMKAFKDYFEVHLAPDEFQRVKIFPIREFRVKSNR